MKFCHTHLHDTYSQLDGLGLVSKVVEKANKLNFKYLASTNHGNIDGLIKFQKECKKKDITPILGMEGYLVKKWNKKEPRGHICFWIKNKKGFKNLCRMVTESNINGFYYRPRIDYKTLLKYHKGLIIGTACVGSFVTRCTDGLNLFKKLVKLKGEDLYIEVMPHNIDIQKDHNKTMIKLANKYNVKVIISQDVHYINKKDWKAHEVLLAIQRKAKWNDKNRWKFLNKGYHLRSTQEMIDAAKKTNIYKKEYFTNTIEIAEKCGNFTIPKQDIKLPLVPEIKKEDENKTLWKLCINGYEKRFDQNVKKNKIYYDRLKFEYDTIIDKNFARYFLIVNELCEWCYNNDIPIGPRGSVSGSLVAFCLKITSVDPIKHNLIFDRFINKQRIDYPDIDIDFPDDKRFLIKEHLEDLYGKNKIAGVSSFSRLKPKAAIQAVARVFDVSPSETDAFTKPIDDKIDNCIEEEIKNNPNAKEYADKYPKVIKFAKALEGNISNYGQHAAALIISIKNIAKTNKCSLLERKGVTLINWEKDDAEYVGLMKLDALSIKELTVIGNTVQSIKENHNKNIKLESIDIENKQVLKNISNGNTIGIFQFNTWAMTNLVKEMRIEEFKHLSDAVALVRPGPFNSGMTKEYIKRKHGKKWEKKNKIYEDITKDTYGIICYQEQIMSIINKVAGLPYSTADKIRKIISKKRDSKEFDQYYKEFLNGCKKTGNFTKKEAKEFWNGLQEHAKYSFNRSHSVSYALVAYWSAWLRQFYPTEFICSALTYGADSKKKELIEEAYRLGLTLKLPKVNISHPTKWVAKNNSLYVPFKEVKNLGDKTSIDASKTPVIENQSKNIRKWISNKKVKTIRKHKGSLGKILDKIGAYDDLDIEITDEVKEMFDFRIVLDPKKQYKKLYELFDYNLNSEELDLALNGNYKILKRLKNKNIIKKVRFKGFDNLTNCTKCELYEGCTRPVHPSIGKYNIMLDGEAPGFKEDLYGRGFYEDAPAGKLLWSKINRKKYRRELFYVSNVTKCYPVINNSKTPTTEQIKICGNKYLKKEIKKVKPIVILAFGNTNRQYFEDINKGILSISGTTNWSEEYGCFICWCVHPAACFRGPSNKPYFNKGMNNFFRTLKSIGMENK